ncbi:Predicted nucleic acid-binding protein, contains PIN domain [Rubrimonas cliftonensis]|uniref:Ribonuclease VapC n=1 Tax=Rubrimonas cliftonensis TaxID=89524 RepID=A0A1H4CX78_9RHOB|nr:Predicted nucleic acid-binding protein, contains PIN domain [Rubrimonas cliftonensis]
MALKWLVGEAGSDAAAALLDGPALLAPELIHVEIANALWRMARVGRIAEADAADALALLARLPLRRRVADRHLAPEALRLAQLLDHPACDCLYLALAMDAGAPVVTADRRFVAAAARDAASAPLVVDLAAL